MLTFRAALLEEYKAEWYERFGDVIFAARDYTTAVRAGQPAGGKRDALLMKAQAFGLMEEDWNVFRFSFEEFFHLDLEQVPLREAAKGLWAALNDVANEKPGADLAAAQQEVLKAAEPFWWDVSPPT